MGYYLLLGRPILNYVELRDYKGLYRDSPYFDIEYNENKELVDAYLWYINYTDSPGINESDYSTLVEFHKILRFSKHFYDIIFYDDRHHHSKQNMRFLGHDVTCNGWYSLLGDGFLLWHKYSQKFKYSVSENLYFTRKLNKYYLFNNYSDANIFKQYLEILNMVDCSAIETCSWDVNCVYEVKCQ